MPVKLEVLDLSNNPLREIPMEVGNLELLKELREWEVGIGLLKALKVFEASGCELSAVPKQLEKLTHLTKLVLSRNAISVFPVEQITPLVRLTHLDLSHNQLTEFPKEIYDLPLLQVN